jgi:NitT/TauT family transport system ATP-binding protein
MGIYMPDYGTIDGVKGKRISCVFQDKRLLLSETVEKNIACVIGKNPQIEKFSMREIWKSISDDYKKSQAKKWLKLMGLNEYCDQKVENLSGGMQQLVSIARALASPKDILLLDEPFVGLDLTLKRKVVKLIKENAKNIITIVVTHDVYHGKLLSDKMYLLSGPPVFAKQVYL